MKLNKIAITISGSGCLGAFDDRDAETDAYVDAFADAVRDAVAREYADAEIEAEVNWNAYTNKISIDGDLDINEGDAVEENVRNTMQELWNNPEKWWNRNSEFHPNAAA